MNSFDIIGEVEEKQSTCRKYNKASLNPAVGFSLQKDLNDVEAMDLKEANGHENLHTETMPDYTVQ